MKHSLRKEDVMPGRPMPCLRPSLSFMVFLIMFMHQLRCISSGVWVTL
jgi:hypothetical protein